MQFTTTVSCKEQKPRKQRKVKITPSRKIAVKIGKKLTSLTAVTTSSAGEGLWVRREALNQLVESQDPYFYEVENGNIVKIILMGQ